jgi:hypothetical protein
MQQKIGASTAYVQDRALMSPVGPDPNLAAVQQYFSYRGYSGLATGGADSSKLTQLGCGAARRP